MYPLKFVFKANLQDLEVLLLYLLVVFLFEVNGVQRQNKLFIEFAGIDCIAIWVFLFAY